MKINVWRSLLVILSLTVLWCVALLPQVQADEQANPDSTGYTWVDNKNPEPFPETPAGEDVAWIEISATGDDLLDGTGLSDLDNDCIGITTPFLPTFFGSLFGMSSAPLYVSINGFVSMGAPVNGTTSAYNTALPSTASPDNIIAVFWDDLDASANGHIYYDVRGTAPNRTIIIQWSNLSFSDETANLNFQLQIYETVTATPFAIVYGNMTSPNSARATGSSATIGLENSTGTSGTLYSYNVPNIIISNETAIAFYPPTDLFGQPTFTKGAGFADHMRILWQQAVTPSVIALHFFVNAPQEENIEVTGIEIEADLPDNPVALDLDESQFFSSINIYEDIDRDANISSTERSNYLVLAWEPSAQQPFENNGILSLTFTNQTVIATGSKVFIVEVGFDQSGTSPLENEGFKLRLHRVSYRGISSNASLIETLDYETGSIYVDDGVNAYGSVSMMGYNYSSDTIGAVSGSDVVALAFKLTVGSVEAVKIENLIFRGISTGNITTDITSVTIYNDNNANGKLDATETSSGTTFSFTNGDYVSISNPFGGEFDAGTINYYIAVMTLRATTDLSMVNSSNQIIIGMNQTYLNLSYYSSPSVLGGSIVSNSFQARVQEFPRPAILCGDVVGRKVIVATQEAVDQDNTVESINGGGCFVATAAFGEYSYSSVVTLCNFRDGVLSNADAGRSLVEYYYSVSTEIANSVSESNSLRAVISKLLGNVTE